MNKLLLTLFVCGGFAVTTLAEDLTGLAEDTGAAVASVKVGDDAETSYNDISEAFVAVNTATEGQIAILTLLNHATLPASVTTIAAGKTVVLNLASKVLTLTCTKGRGIRNDGDLTITADSGNPGGIKFTDAGISAGLIDNHGSLTINGGNFTDTGVSGENGGALICNQPGATALTITRGTFKETYETGGASVISSSATTTVTITGGTFDCQSNSQPAFKFTAGTAVIGVAGRNSAVQVTSELDVFDVTNCDVTILGGSFYAKRDNNSNIIYGHASSKHTITVEGGIFDVYSTLFYLTDSSRLNIQGGTFSYKSTDTDATPRLFANTVASGAAEFSGGTFEGLDPKNCMPEGCHIYEKPQGSKTLYIIYSASNWSELADTSWYDNDPDASAYTITTPEQLAGLATLVNAGNTFHGKTVNLGNHIRLETREYCQWTPIGTTSHHFSGTFDGQGFTVSGLTIDYSTDESTDEKLGGLFGSVCAGVHDDDGDGGDSSVNGVVKNVTVTGDITGATIAGGIVASMNGGTIRLCRATVKIAETTTSGLLVGKVDGVAKILENGLNATSLNDAVGEMVNDGANLIIGESVRFAYDKAAQDTEYKVVSGLFLKLNGKDSTAVLAPGSTIAERDETTQLYTVTTSATAPDYVALSGYVMYTNLQEAVEHDYVQPNATIELLKSIALTKTVSIDKALVLEMKGYEIAPAAAASVTPLLTITAPLLTIRNGTLTDVGGSGGQRLLYIGAGSVVTMSGCTIDATQLAIDCDGSLDWESGTITAGLTAVRLGMTAGANTTTTRFILREGTVKQALAIMNGEVEIRGGTLDMTEFFAASHYAGINFYLTGKASLAMTGGILKVDYLKNLFYAAESGDFTIAISGGMFNQNEIPETYFVQGSALSETPNAMDLWSVETAVAKIGDTTYPSLEKALEAATNGKEVKLLCDIHATTNEYTIAKNITLNLGPYTIYNARLRCTNTTEGTSYRLSIMATTGGIVNATGCIYAVNKDTVVRIYDGNYICSPNVNALSKSGSAGLYPFTLFGGTFSAAGTAGSTNLDTYIKNPTLNTTSAFDQLRADCILRDNGDTTYTVVPDYVAKRSKSNYYKTLIAAIEAANNGDTVTIVSQHVTWPKALPDLSKITIKLDTYTTTPAPVGYKWNDTRTLVADYTPLAIVPGNVGGTAGVTLPVDGQVEENDKLTFTATQQEGYTFTGWTTPDGKYVSTAATAEVTVTTPESIMLTANFIPTALLGNVITNTVGQLSATSPTIKVESVMEGETTTLVANIALQLMKTATLDDTTWEEAVMDLPELDTEKKILRIKLPLTDAATQFFYFAPMKE